MTDDRVTLIVFLPNGGRTGPERLVAGGKVATTLDLIETGLECPLVDRVVVATDSVELARRLHDYDRVILERDDPDETFHFGRRLLEIVERYRIGRPLYFGGGSAPLLAPESLEELCGRLLSTERTVIANNIWSADFFGFSPREALRRVQLPARHDNNLPFLLSRQAGLQAEPLEMAIENTFDIDTPTDLAILKLQGTAKPHARRFLDSVDLNTDPLEAVMPNLLSLHSQITLVGRVSTAIWGRPMTDIPGQKRLYVEERGMKASGREARGEVRSLMGFLTESVGPERLFEYLASFSHAIFFDTRVLFNHLKLNLSDNDRFASDLRDVDAIEDPVARRFTAAACECPVPVILGGQNIVSGALWALTQEAWNRADAGLIAPSPQPQTA